MSSSPRATDPLSSIRQYLNERDYSKVVFECQEFELELEEHSGLRDVEIENLFDRYADFYTIFMLSLLIEANLNEAKYLWKRCPYSLKTNADGLYGKLWGVGQIMWKGDIAMAVMESAKLAAQFQNHILSEHLLSLKAATFISLLRTLTTLYTKVTAATVAGMIGITSEEELASELAKVNWSIDATTGLVKSNDPQVLTLAEEKVFSNLEYNLATMGRMAQYVAFLQRPSLKVDLSNKDTKSQNPSTPTPASVKR